MNEITATRPAVITYAEYLHPGAFLAEESVRPVAARDPARVAREAPESVFAFRFYDVVTVTATISGRPVPLRSAPVSASGWYYIDAVKLTAASVAALPGDHRILLDNMRNNGWDPILRCRAGNFRPLDDGGQTISSTTGELT